MKLKIKQTQPSFSEVEIPDNNLSATKHGDDYFIVRTVVDDMYIEANADTTKETFAFRIVPAKDISDMDVKKLQAGLVEVETLDLVMKSLRAFTAMFEGAIQRNVKANQS